MGKLKIAREKHENAIKNEWEMRKNEPISKSLSRACKSCEKGSQDNVNHFSIRATSVHISLRLLYGLAEKTFFNPRASLLKGNLVRVFKKNLLFFPSFFFSPFFFFFPCFLLFSLFSSHVCFYCLGVYLTLNPLKNAFKNPLKNTLKNTLKNHIRCIDFQHAEIIF